jgi:hypothetical protein
MQVVENDAPVVVRYVPAAQIVQLVVPVLPAKKPAAQGEQALAPPKEKNPTAQFVHAVETIDPALPFNVPGGHSVHDDMPVTAA